MFQPRQTKKWSRAEKWVLGLSFPAIVIFSWWSLRQPDRVVSFGPTRMRLAEAHFERLPRPIQLRASWVKFQQKTTSSHRLVPVCLKAYLGFDGGKPDWWGKSLSFRCAPYHLRSSEGVDFFPQCGSRVVFDAKRQQYRITGEYLLPDEEAFLQGGTLFLRGKVGLPAQFARIDDNQSPIVLQRKFQVATTVRVESN